MSDEQQPLSDEKHQEIADSLDAETFDLNNFLANKWDYPTFSCTIYLDGERAGRIAELDEQVAEAERKAQRLQNRSKQQSSGSLAGGGKDQEVREAEAYVETLKNERDELATEFRKSSLKIVFQQQDDSRTVHNFATKKTKEKFPNLSDKQIAEDPDADEYHGRWLIQQLIKDVYNYKGQRHASEVTFENVEALLEQVVASERSKIRNNMLQALSGGNVMKQAADAGFPR